MNGVAMKVANLMRLVDSSSTKAQKRMRPRDPGRHLCQKINVNSITSNPRQIKTKIDVVIVANVVRIIAP